MTRKSQEPTKSFYITGGNRIELEHADDLVAIDRQRIEAMHTDRFLSKSGRQISQGIEILTNEEIDETTMLELKNHRVIRSVYRSSGAILVLLPEIRMESENAHRLDEIAEELNAKLIGMVEASPGRIRWIINDEHATNTLRLANQLIERFPEVSITPRFLRIVDRPNITRK